jgi:hypothetical protein
MRIIRRKEQELVPEGMYRARLIRIEDVDPVEGSDVRRLRFIWQLLDYLDSDGKPVEKFDTFPSVSLSPKSFMGKAIQAILGYAVAGDEFDVDSLLNVERNLVLKHNQGNNGNTYCNIAATIPIPKPVAEKPKEKPVLPATEALKAAAPKTAARKAHVIQQTPPPPPPDETTITDDDIAF